MKPSSIVNPPVNIASSDTIQLRQPSRTTTNVESISAMWHERLMGRMVESSVVLTPERSFRHRVLLAVGLVGIATAIRYSLGLAFGISSIFLLYHPAVFIAAWFGRFSCGVLATTLSVLAIRFFWVEPQFSLAELTAAIGDLGVFFVIGIFQSFLIELFQRSLLAQKEANEKLAEARADLEKRVAERTAELVSANDRLKVEIVERQQAEELERFYAQRSKALSVRLVELQEAEHRRIARELHDEIGQSLTGLKVVLGLAARKIPSEIRDKFDEAEHLAQDVLNRVREMSLDLRPSMLDDLGLMAALPWLFERFTRQTEITVNFKHSPFPERLSPELETTIFRITQEALTNVARHSKAREVTARLWRDDEVVRFQIEDNGRGFDVEKALASRASTGLSGMQERVALVGGELTLESSPGSGTRVTAELPLKSPMET